MNSSDSSIIPVLFLITLLVFIAIGIWQYNRARKAKQEHKHSSLGNTSDTPSTSAPATPRREGDRVG